MEDVMRAVGYLATSLAAAAAVGVVVLLVQSLPEIRRYLRMLSM